MWGRSNFFAARFGVGIWTLEALASTLAGAFRQEIYNWRRPGFLSSPFGDSHCMQRLWFLLHSSVPFAEFTASWIRVFAAIHHKAPCIWSEEDSTTMIAWLIHPYRFPNLHIPLLKELRHRIASSTCFKISLVMRKANRLADRMASNAIQENFMMLSASDLRSRWSSSTTS